MRFLIILLNVGRIRMTTLSEIFMVAQKIGNYSIVRHLICFIVKEG